MTVLTAPITAFGAMGIKAAGDFGSAMAEIAARTGLVGEELEQVRQFALRMGADTVFSGQQAAEAFLQLLTSGSSVAEAMEILPSVLNAAAAGVVDSRVSASANTTREKTNERRDNLCRRSG
jgi:TP901 family phage tail tape measure protein